MKTKAILMDIGGVVFINAASEHNFSRMSRLFGKSIGVDPAILNQIRKTHLQESLTGNFSNQDFYREIEVRTGKKLPKNIEDIWVQVNLPEAKINKQLLKWIDETRKHCKVVAFSTVSSLRLSLDRALGIYGHFDAEFLSCELGMTKSNPEFFRHALDILKIAPEEALLIDDQPKNISRAAAAGVKGLLYKPEYYHNHGLFLAAVASYQIN